MQIGRVRYKLGGINARSFAQLLPSLGQTHLVDLALVVAFRSHVLGVLLLELLHLPEFVRLVQLILVLDLLVHLVGLVPGLVVCLVKLYLGEPKSTLDWICFLLDSAIKDLSFCLALYYFYLLTSL